MKIIYEKDSLGRTFIEFVFKNTGSIYAKDGVAYFLMYLLMTEGNSKNKEKFYSKLEERAVNLSTYTTYANSGISLKFLNEKSTFALNALKELLSSPNFSQEAFERVKEKIKAKKRTLQNDYDYVASKNLFKAIFKGTPLERAEIGEDIDAITLDDIKSHFQNLSKEALIVLIGGKKVDVNKIKTILPSKTPPKDLFFKPQKSDIEVKRDVKQSYIYFASPFDVPKEKWYLAKTATFILGAGGFGSRLMEEVRVKRGYAYSAYASNHFTKNYQILKGFLQTKLENTKDAKNLVTELIGEFVTKGVSKEELESAKKFLTGSEPLRNETTIQRLKKKFEEYYYGLEKGYFKKELELIKNITPDELNEFIKSHKEITDLSFSIVTK